MVRLRTTREEEESEGRRSIYGTTWTDAAESKENGNWIIGFGMNGIEDSRYL